MLFRKFVMKIKKNLIRSRLFTIYNITNLYRKIICHFCSKFQIHQAFSLRNSNSFYRLLKYLIFYLYLSNKFCKNEKLIMKQYCTSVNEVHKNEYFSYYLGVLGYTKFDIFYWKKYELLMNIHCLSLILFSA